MSEQAPFKYPRDELSGPLKDLLVSFGYEDYIPRFVNKNILDFEDIMCYDDYQLKALVDCSLVPARKIQQFVRASTVPPERYIDGKPYYGASSSGCGGSGYTATPILNPFHVDPDTDSVFTKEAIEGNCKNIFSDDLDLQQKSTQKFRRMLSMTIKPPFEAIVKTGVVSRFVEFLTRVDSPSLQFEAAWALKVIATKHTTDIVTAGGLPIFIQLLRASSGPEAMREMAASALGSLAAASTEARDKILSLEAMPILLQISWAFSENTKISLARIMCTTIKNLCGGVPVPNFEEVRDALPLLERLLCTKDISIVIDSVWTIASITNGEDEGRDAVLNQGVVAKKLVELLRHPDTIIVAGALRTLGNILKGTEIHTQLILDLPGALSNMFILLSHPKLNIRKEACWAVSNISAGTVEQKQLLIDQDVYPTLIEIISTGRGYLEVEVQTEAIWVIANATNEVASRSQIKFLVEKHAIEPLFTYLHSLNESIVNVVLEAIEHFLRFGIGEGPGYYRSAIVKRVSNVDGQRRLHALQLNFLGRDIADRSKDILKTYFPDYHQYVSGLPIGKTVSSYHYGVLLLAKQSTSK